MQTATDTVAYNKDGDRQCRCSRPPNERYHLCFAVRTRVPDHGFAGAPVEWHDCLFYAAADMLVITRTIFSPLDSILAALAVIALACTLLMRSRHD